MNEWLISHMLHASYHLGLPIYQLICLPINLLLLPVHLYFLYYNVGVNGVLWPVRIFLNVKICFFRLWCLKCLAESLIIFITWPHWGLWWLIILGREIGTNICRSFRWGSFASSWLCCASFNNTRGSRCWSLWWWLRWGLGSWKRYFLFFKSKLLSEGRRHSSWLSLMIEFACWGFCCICHCWYWGLIS